MAKKQTIHINGSDIIVLKQKTDDYISLTDMAKYKNAEATGIVISHWLSTRYALDYLGIFERLNNPNFNVTEFGNIRAEAGSNGFVLTVKQWVERTGAIGIISTPGRYGGTYAHRDIALEFASWLSAELKYYMVRELQRLKDDENERLQLNWTLQRTLSKINYRIHTDAIKDVLLPPEVTRERANFKYASEADLLNVALFGQTAREWRDTHPEDKGNIRDNATLEQLVVLSNLESINSVLIRQGLTAPERLQHLNQTARTQMQSLLDNAAMKQLRELPGADDLPQLLE